MNQRQDKRQGRKNDRGRTNVPGGNPRQNDAVDHDLYNDENRRNPLAEEQTRKQ
jgi:hypothetical protein